MKQVNDIITSRQNPLVKRVAALQDRKGRRASEAFVAEGEKLTLEAARAGLPVTHILVRADADEALLARLRAAFDAPSYEKTELVLLSEGAFEKVTGEKTPRGVVSVIKYLDFFKYMDIIDKEEFLRLGDRRALILCSVRDPGNLGSVLRSAVAFGVEHVFLSDDCADIYSPKTVRAAMGSMFHVGVSIVRDMPSLVRSARALGRRVLAAELRPGALSLREAALVPSDLLMIGNEGHGIPAELSTLSDASVYIPIAEATESLNAAVAAAVLMFAQREATNA